MELTAWIDTLIVELPGLLTCLKSNTFPDAFLKNVFGFSDSFLSEFPRYLTIFVSIYFICGIVTLILRFTRGQKSLCSASRQINNVILTCCCTIFVPLLILLVKGCAQVLKSIAPLQGASDLLRFLGESLASIFYPIMALCGLLFTVWMPISSALRYLKVYHFRGLPHMVFDVGTGFFVIAIFLLAAFYNQRALYALLLPAIIMLCLIQRGGYIAEEQNTRTAQTLQEQEKSSSL